MRRQGIAFAADLHLRPGHQPDQNAKLSAFLFALSTERLILLGDTFHGWFERGGRYIGAFDEVATSFSQAAAAGLQIHLVSGNRDFVIGSAPASYPGFFQHPTERYRSVLTQWGIQPEGPVYRLTYGSLRITCTHGDAFCTRNRPYQILRWLLQGPIGRWGMSVGPFGVAKWIVGWIQNRPLRLHRDPVSWYQTIVDEAVATEIDRGADLVVCGHLHHKEERRLRGSGGKEARLVIVPSWSETGEYLELRGSEWVFQVAPPNVAIE